MEEERWCWWCWWWWLWRRKRRRRTWCWWWYCGGGFCVLVVVVVVVAGVVVWLPPSLARSLPPSLPHSLLLPLTISLASFPFPRSLPPLDRSLARSLPSLAPSIAPSPARSFARSLLRSQCALFEICGFPAAYYLTHDVNPRSVSVFNSALRYCLHLHSDLVELGAFGVYKISRVNRGKYFLSFLAECCIFALYFDLYFAG